MTKTKPHMRNTTELHQGMFLDGKKPYRRWIAVILSEDDVAYVLDEINKERREKGEEPVSIDELDIDHLAYKYSDAMTEGWTDTMRALLDDLDYFRKK